LRKVYLTERHIHLAHFFQLRRFTSCSVRHFSDSGHLRHSFGGGDVFIPFICLILDTVTQKVMGRFLRYLANK